MTFISKHGSGNFMVDGSDKILDEKGACVCGSDNHEDIFYCTLYKKECEDKCPSRTKRGCRLGERKEDVTICRQCGKIQGE